MMKATLINNKKYIFLFLIGILIACSSGISKTDLVLIAGKYHNQADQSLYSGVAITKFRDNTIQSETVIENGVVKTVKSFGHEGELIGESKYETMSIQSNTIDESVIRTVFVSSSEGDYQYYSIKLIVRKGTKDDEILKTKTLEAIRNSANGNKLAYRPLTFKISEGELEPDLFRQKME